MEAQDFALALSLHSAGRAEALLADEALAVALQQELAAGHPLADRSPSPSPSSPAYAELDDEAIARALYEEQVHTDDFALALAMQREEDARASAAPRDRARRRAEPADDSADPVQLALQRSVQDLPAAPRRAWRPPGTTVPVYRPAQQPGSRRVVAQHATAAARARRPAARAVPDRQQDLDQQLAHMLAHMDFDDDAALQAAPLTDADIGNSYEELLALDERIERVGLSAADVQAKTLVQTLTERDLAGFSEPCVICLDRYEAGQRVRRLPCFCCYHADCIDEHLRADKKCPKCRKEVGAEQ
mgnify:CR=1 FL=1